MNHRVQPDPNGTDRAALVTWLQAACSPEEQATLRNRIAVHEQRLQDLSPAARNEAVVDALLRDAMTNPTLAGALQRLQRRSVDRHQQRALRN